MKKSLLFLFIVFNFYVSHAQAVFAPPGAKWRCAFKTSGNSNEYAGDIYYAGDSLIGTESLKILKYHSFFNTSGGNACFLTLIRQRADTIFMKNCNTNNTWQILYNFAATVGQNWTTTVIDPMGSNTSVTYTIVVNAISASPITMNLKKLSVSYCYVSPYTGMLQCDAAEIIDRVGCTTYLFNYVNKLSVSNYEELKYFYCYKDNTLGNYPVLGGSTCYYTLGVSEHNLISGNIKLYPVPANNILTLEISDNDLRNYDIKIVDALGQLVLEPENSIINSKADIDVSVLKGGVYFLQLFDAGKLYGVQKIIRNNK